MRKAILETILAMIADLTKIVAEQTRLLRALNDRCNVLEAHMDIQKERIDRLLYEKNDG